MFTVKSHHTNTKPEVYLIEHETDSKYSNNKENKHLHHDNLNKQNDAEDDDIEVIEKPSKSLMKASNSSIFPRWSTGM